MEILCFLLLQLSTKQKEHPKSIHNAFLQLQAAAKFSRPHIWQIQNLKYIIGNVFFSLAPLNDFAPAPRFESHTNLSFLSISYYCISIFPWYNCSTERKADVLGLKILMLLSRPHNILHALASISYPSILPSYNHCEKNCSTIVVVSRFQKKNVPIHKRHPNKYTKKVFY